MPRNRKFARTISFAETDIIKKVKKNKNLLGFVLELTPRCNNNCRHCYINTPADKNDINDTELSLNEISSIADQAVSLGAIYCLITGGEPLLRKDFFDIYLCLRSKGLLVTVFTNATLITEKHIKLFEKYFPRSIEITVYGTTKETYEKITRKEGSFHAFTKGLNLLHDSGVKVRLKTVGMRSNLHELSNITRFCRDKTKQKSRLDCVLNLRYDRDTVRNEEIRSERLSPEEIVKIEREDAELSRSSRKTCDHPETADIDGANDDRIFRCTAGVETFSVSYDGFFRPCALLRHPDFAYNLREGTVYDAWNNFIPRVLSMRSQNEFFISKCAKCGLFNSCFWCPAHAYLEVGRIDKPIDYFCKIAHIKEGVDGIFREYEDIANTGNIYKKI